MTVTTSKIRSAERRLERAEMDVEEARSALEALRLQAARETLGKVHWEVLRELSIGGMLVRYEDPSNDPFDNNHNGENLPRRFLERPGCLISGESNRRTPVSDKTMADLERAGLAHWVTPRNAAHEMKITPEGEKALLQRVDV